MSSEGYLTFLFAARLTRMCSERHNNLWQFKIHDPSQYMKEAMKCFRPSERRIIRMIIKVIKPRKKHPYLCNLPVKSNKESEVKNQEKLICVRTKIDHITPKGCVPHAITSMVDPAMQPNAATQTVGTTREAFAASATTHSTIARRKTERRP